VSQSRTLRAREPGRIFTLDVLRGIAIWMVLFRHMPGDGWAPAGRALKSVGWCGVDLFFVLSGYLISGLLYREFDRTGGIDVTRFWLRRGLKIWPSYFAIFGAAVILFVGHAAWSGDAAQVRKSLANAAVNCAFIQNYMPEREWPHSWSLAVEEQFYLAFPLWLAGLLFARRRFDLVPAAAAAAALTVLSARVSAACRGATWDVLYYRTHFRADGLMIGAAAGYLAHYRTALYQRLIGAPLLLALAAPAALALPLALPLQTSPVVPTVGFTLLAVGFGGLVLLAGARPDFGRGGPRPLRWVCRMLACSGVYSYTIYLVHAVVGSVHEYGIDRALGVPSALTPVLFLVASLAGGVLASHAVERPALRLRERWLPARGPGGRSGSSEPPTPGALAERSALPRIGAGA
jgi:peptidoglycan/LPS O-acetylase OafA/YrhL